MQKMTRSQKIQQANKLTARQQHTDKGPHKAHAKPDSQQIHRDHTTHSSQTSVIIDK